jgi:hypothetical protein
MHIDHGLLHGLEYLGLHSLHLLKSRRRGRWWIDIIIVVLPIVLNFVVGGTVPFVDHLSMSIDEIKNTQKNDSRGKGIVTNPQR